jgi:integrase
MGIYNKKQKVENRIENVKTSDQISEENTSYFEEFYNWGRTKRDWSHHRTENYLYSLQKMIENNDFPIKELDQEKFDKLLIQIKDSEWKERGNGGYSSETKADFRKTLKRICEHQDKIELLPTDQYGQIDLKTHVPSSEKNKTRPDELPSLKDAKKIAQKIEERSRNYAKLRNLSLFFVLYEGGMRIGEALNIQMRDLDMSDKKVTEIYVPGNKESDDRWNAFVIANPVLRRYIENGHPCPNNGDAYLFASIKENKGSQMKYRNAKKIFDQAGEAAELNSKFNPHVFRKKRISFLKTYMNMSEANIDKQVGHAVGSDTTRFYTRISDEEVLDQYKNAYGLTERKDENPERILWPKKCSCETLVSGHRDVCHSCGEVVNKLAFSTEIDYGKEKELEAMGKAWIDIAEESEMERELFEEIMLKKVKEWKKEVETSQIR